MKDESVTVTDVYFRRDDGSVTAVRICNGIVLSVEDNAPILITVPYPDILWVEQESIVPKALIEG